MGLGAAWAVLQSFATTLVFTRFLGRVAAQADSEVPHWLYLFASLLPWTFLANSFSADGLTVVAIQNLVKMQMPLWNNVVQRGICLVEGWPTPKRATQPVRETSENGWRQESSLVAQEFSKSWTAAARPKAPM
jgi:hypothetical protein